MIIYSITNTLNGKMYIGMTTLTLAQRKAEHWKKFKGGVRGQALYAAFHKYGWDAFEWSEICCAWDRSHLLDLERDLIRQFNTLESGYNMTEGGDGVIGGEYESGYWIRFPNGEVHKVKGYKRFCRDHGLNEGCLWHTYKPYTGRYRKKNGVVSEYVKTSRHHKGYTLLGRLIDYPFGEYTQAGGNGGQPEQLGLMI